MKKILFIIMLGVVVLSFTACNSPQEDEEEQAKEEDSGDQGDIDLVEDQKGEGEEEHSLEEMIELIYATAEINDAFKEYVQDGTFFEEVNADNAEYHLGKADIEFEVAVASEPMMQPSAYSLVLLRVKEGGDVEAIKDDIRDNVDPVKWVCVGVEEDNVIVDSVGDIIFIVMSDEQAKPLHEAFLALGE